MASGSPKAERDGLIASDPETFFLPPTRDLRYQWVCAHLDRLDHEEMRELVVDAWRMCTPAMLHDLPEMPVPAAAAWSAHGPGRVERAAAAAAPRLCTSTTGRPSRRGRTTGPRAPPARPTPKPPRDVEVRDGQVYRWVR